MSKFIIATTPRTRTAWLSTWLTYGKCYCMHELLQFCESFEEMNEILDSVGGNVGNSDMANVLFIDSVLNVIPDAKIVLITRPDWVESAAEIGIKTSDATIELINLGIERVRQRSPLEFTMTDLDNYENLAIIWEYVTGKPDVEARTRQLMNLNIQPHLPIAFPIWNKNAKNFEKLMKQHTKLLAPSGR